VGAVRDLHMHMQIALALVALVTLVALERRPSEVDILQDRVAISMLTKLSTLGEDSVLYEKCHFYPPTALVCNSSLMPDPLSISAGDNRVTV
jgi:hypothetical protein